MICSKCRRDVLGGDEHECPSDLRADAMQDIQWSRGYWAGWNAALDSSERRQRISNEAANRRSTEALLILKISAKQR